ncbi:hypothetical protein OUZ56_018302 [Daphnia magna]|uniref:Uncharacterized protein n=1 Tax=Daphnia magna TaxID=35525 RepID=A0ABQ9Z8G7_9CRUS|nr:hypothetical protein OUZ56_018302 [Daphnia magna]
MREDGKEVHQREQGPLPVHRDTDMTNDHRPGALRRGREQPRWVSLKTGSVYYPDFCRHIQVSLDHALPRLHRCLHYRSAPRTH